MNGSLLKSQIGAERHRWSLPKLQTGTDKHRYTEGPCRDCRQAQIDTDRFRELEVQHGAHNLLELRGQVWKQVIIQIQIETVIYEHHMIWWRDSNSNNLGSLGTFCQYPVWFLAFNLLLVCYLSSASMFEGSAVAVACQTKFLKW